MFEEYCLPYFFKVCNLSDNILWEQQERHSSQITKPCSHLLETLLIGIMALQTQLAMIQIDLMMVQFTLFILCRKSEQLYDGQNLKKYLEKGHDHNHHNITYLKAD